MGDSPYVGEISMFAGNYAPYGWAICDGSILQIVQYQALYSILGITYGGDGRSTFALPDLRGRLPLGAGNGPGLRSHALGDKQGVDQTILQTQNLPQHAHGISPSKPITAKLKAVNNSANTPSPEEAYIAMQTGNAYRDSGATVEMNAGSIAVDASGLTATQPVGQGTPFDNLPPFQCINFIIALEGIYPPRP